MPGVRLPANYETLLASHRIQVVNVPPFEIIYIKTTDYFLPLVSVAAAFFAASSAAFFAASSAAFFVAASWSPFFFAGLPKYDGCNLFNLSSRIVYTFVKRRMGSELPKPEQLITGQQKPGRNERCPHKMVHCGYHLCEFRLM